ncbi:hypothetical protein EDF48_103371 [Curtobacterium sp. PhB191]|uniref:hypothetical protein n=1 Tax=Curtobacterium sp. PhB191 TaxID=2485202 RepID=UPI00104FE089|nr:hypothetical protein [Curtobacterium sp. PhB191]TCU86066.1 hypothetical protein EDF48_103371 [Curtobacterium sp. PhB191]
MTRFFPFTIDVRELTLTQLAASRIDDVETKGPRSATVSFTTIDVERLDDGFAVATSYEVSLTNVTGEQFASLKSQYTISFVTSENVPEDLDPESEARLQLAAAEVTHPYHRQALLGLTQQFEIPSFRLAVQFPRADFVESFFAQAEREQEQVQDER